MISSIIAVRTPEAGFLGSKTTQDIIVFDLEKLGEAPKQMSQYFPEFSGDAIIKEFAGLRDVIIHKYLDVDYKLIWKIAKEDIPVIKNKIESIKRIGKK